MCASVSPHVPLYRHQTVPFQQDVCYGSPVTAEPTAKCSGLLCAPTEAPQIFQPAPHHLPSTLFPAGMPVPAQGYGQPAGLMQSPNHNTATQKGLTAESAL